MSAPLVRRSRKMMIALCLSSLGAALPLAAATDPAPLSLFNGTSMLGWNAHGTWVPSGGTLSSGGEGDRSVLTAVPFADFSLKFEYNESALTGAKLRLWTNRENNGGLSVDLDLSNTPSGIGGIDTFSNSSIASLPSGWHHIQVDASRGQMNVRVDGLPSGSASGLGSRAGYIGFQASGSGNLQVRNIKLIPLNVTTNFNGIDLSGWKSIARKPDAKGGVGHTMEKAFTLGIGGGSTKPHEAKWSVHSGAIHGEDGPGGLENGTMTEDAIIQLMVSVKGEVKKENFTALLLRNPADQLTGGYGIGIGPYAGSIDHLENHSFGRPDVPVDETIVIGGRTMAVWINGSLAVVHTDSRPDSNNSAQGARTSGGPSTLLLPTVGEQVEVQRFNLTALPKAYGLPAHAPQPPPPVVQAVGAAPASAAVPAVPSAADTAVVQQQKEMAKKDANDQQSKQRVASLMGQALATSDQHQQMAAYGQVVQIDPSNAAAVQGYKEAQQKLQSQQDAESNATTTAAAQQQNAESRDQQTGAALAEGQAAFLSGHLGAASSAISIAERLSPSNPLVRELRSRISVAQSLRSRLYFLGGGVGLLALAGIIAMWLRRRKMQQFPVLEITRGLDEGQSYQIEKDVIRIGAVAQDGGQRNEIVIRDIEHAVSRFHCEVVRRGGQLYVSDLNSSNGTRVNGTSIKPGSPEILRKGNRILLANTVELRFGYNRAAKKSS